MQGCLNGYGERCGNANLASIIANLELKLGHTTIGPEKLQDSDRDRALHRRTGQPADAPRPAFRRPERLRPQGRHPRQRRDERFGHLRTHRPELVGNHQRVLVSDLSGHSNMVYRLRQHGLADRLPEEARRELLEKRQGHGDLGYDLETADGTFELFVRQALHPGVDLFEVENYEVSIKSGQGVTATVKIAAQDGVHTATASGHGPVHALDVACASASPNSIRSIADVRLTDYKVRVLDTKKGTAAKVRVLVEWSDHRKSWSTVGVSDDVIEASWNALVDALRLELMRLTEPVDSLAR